MSVDVKALLTKHGLQAKKSWGQNFLIDERVYEAIVKATVAGPGDWIVEIGAGLGTLTSRLADAVPDGRVLAIERDRDMIRVLQAELGARANVELVEANALKFDYEAARIRAGQKLSLAGNLPYQIASPLLFAMLEARASLKHMVVMLQKEMADRLVAAPDTNAYGALGAMVGLYADVKPIVKARAHAFHPAPRVDSTVVKLTPLAAATRFPVDEKAYSRVVHAAFNQRRKTLRNALRSATKAAEEILAAAKIDKDRRGETLSVEEFARLANELAKEGDAGAP
jgi:16S rRNA (adenine1518-N6/adenine1519-N6)-dimethyltransferase